MNTKQLYTGIVVSVSIDTVRLPNGNIVDLEVVHHPGAAAVVALKDDGIVVLIRQFRHAVGGFIYEIPAGKLHLGEDPVVCAARELEEEVGYRAETYEHLSSIFSAPGFTDEIIHVYLATQLVKGRQDLDHDEVLDVLELPLSKAMNMIETGVIRDAKSIVGLQAVYLRKNPR